MASWGLHALLELRVLEFSEGAMFWTLVTGLSLHSQVEHHVQDKFATPILYGIDNFKFYDFFLHIHDHR